MKPPNDPRDIFASDEHAARHPEVYGRPERSLTPGAVTKGEANAEVRLKKEKAIARRVAAKKRQGA